MRASTLFVLLVQTSASEDIFIDDGLSLLQLRVSQESDDVLRIGYPVGEGYEEVSSEQGCRDLATQWGMELGGGGFAFSSSYSTKGCYTYGGGAFRCKAFYGTGGDEAAQLSTNTGAGQGRLGEAAQGLCAPDWEPADDASATGDPHLTTNTGKHYDYGSNLQFRQESDEDEVLSLGQVTSEQACRDLATQWGMQLGQYDPSQKMYGQKFSGVKGAGLEGCWTYTGGPYSCVAFYGQGGDEASQLAPPSNSGTAGPRSRLNAAMQAQCAPNLATADDAAATGDPHLTTNTDKHYDYTTK